MALCKVGCVHQKLPETITETHVKGKVTCRKGQKRNLYIDGMKEKNEYNELKVQPRLCMRQLSHYWQKLG